MLLFLSFFLFGCQTNNFDIFNTHKFTNNSKEISSSFSFQNRNSKPPKYNSFSTKNAKTNIKKAILYHPTFKKSLASLAQRKSNIKQIKASKESQINFQALGGYAWVDENNELGLTGSVNYSKLLYDYGAVDQAVEAEKLKIKAAEFEVKSQAETIAFSAYQNWINLVSQQKILSIYKKGIKNAAPLVEKIDKISLSGIADSTLILRARKEYSETIVKMKQAEVIEKGLNEKFKDIFSLTKDYKIDALKPKNVKTLKYHSNLMIKNSPVLNAKRALIKSLEITKESLEAQKNPNLTLRAGVNAPADNPIQNGSANVGLLLNYIYDDGGKIDAQIENLENQISFSEIDYNNYLKDIKLELSVAHKAYIGAGETKNNLLELIKLSEDVRNNLNDQLAIGRAKLQDVLSAEVNLANNKILLLNTERDLLLNIYKIQYLSAGLFSNTKWY